MTSIPRLLPHAALALACFAPFLQPSRTDALPQDPPRPAVKAPAAAPGEAQDPAEAQKEKNVRELLRLLEAEKLAEAALKGMIEPLREMPNLPEGFLDKFEELAKPEELVEISVPAYMKHLDAKTVDAALAFFRTEGGKRYAAAQGPIQSEAMKAGQEWGRKHAERVLRELQGK